MSGALVRFSLPRATPQWGLVTGDRLRALDCATESDRAVIRAFREQPERLQPYGDDYALSSVRLLAPLPDDAAVYGVGLNYADHARELDREVAAIPHFFLKAPGSLAGTGVELELPRFDVSLDYEGELGVVIGRPCRYVPPSRVAEVIAGYVVCNDVTLRALASPATLLLAKSGSAMAVVGPWITPLTPEDAANLRIQTWVNEELRQDSSSAQMVHNIAQLVALLSRSLLLRPGDVIFTGSPFGCGASFDPPRYLCDGDRVRVRIERLGEIESRVVPQLVPPEWDFGAVY